MMELLDESSVDSKNEKLSFADIELCGKTAAGVSGELKIDRQGMGWKSIGGQKIVVLFKDLKSTQWRLIGPSYMLSFLLINGSIHKFSGFKEEDFGILENFFSKTLNLNIQVAQTSRNGWNWGKLSTENQVIDFTVQNNICFQLPMDEINSATSNKNDVVLTFNSEDSDSEVDALMELKFWIPNVDENSSNNRSSENTQISAEKLTNTIQNCIIPASSKPLMTLKYLSFLTPNGRYDLQIFNSFLRMHGKTDHRIKYCNIIRLFKLPKPDNKNVFFVISLEPSIRQGHTSYQHLVVQLSTTDEVTLDVDEKALEDSDFKSLGKIQSGPICEVVARSLQLLTGLKISIPKNTGFKSVVSGNVSPALRCSLKTSLGYLFPLEHSFMFVHKPPTHIRFENVESVDFASTALNSFDFQVNTNTGSTTFANIQKIELHNLLDFCKSKNLRILNLISSVDSSQNVSMKVDEIEDEDEHGRITIKKNKSSHSDDDDSEDEHVSVDFGNNKRPSRRAAAESRQKTKTEISKDSRIASDDDDESTDLEFDEKSDQESSEEEDEEEEEDLEESENENSTSSASD